MNEERDEFDMYRVYFEKLEKIRQNYYKEDSMPNPMTDWWIGLCRTKKLLMMKDQLNVSFYVGSCRNAQFAYWTGSEFIHVREKFGSEFPEKINHFEDCNGFDVFKPYFELTDEYLKIPFIQSEINKLKTYLKGEENET